MYLSDKLPNIFDDQSDPRTDQFFPDLTNREIEVLKYICAEKNTQEIADLLFLSPYTIESHRANLLLKVGARNTAGLVKWAVENESRSVDSFGKGIIRIGEGHQGDAKEGGNGQQDPSQHQPTEDRAPPGPPPPAPVAGHLPAPDWAGRTSRIWNHSADGVTPAKRRLTCR